jgi:hypothetical protein
VHCMKDTVYVELFVRVIRGRRRYTLALTPRSITCRTGRGMWEKLAEGNSTKIYITIMRPPVEFSTGVVLGFIKRCLMNSVNI